MHYVTLARNLIIYIVGLAVAIPGALGLVNVIEIQSVVAAVLLAIGLALVIAVHEWLDGPF